MQDWVGSVCVARTVPVQEASVVIANLRYLQFIDEIHWSQYNTALTLSRLPCLSGNRCVAVGQLHNRIKLWIFAFRQWFYLRDAMLAQVLTMALCLSVCLSVCLRLSQVGVLSKWPDVLSWFLARRLLRTYAILCFKEICISTKIRVHPFGT